MPLLWYFKSCYFLVIVPSFFFLPLLHVAYQPWQFIFSSLFDGDVSCIIHSITCHVYCVKCHAYVVEFPILSLLHVTCLSWFLIKITFYVAGFILGRNLNSWANIGLLLLTPIQWTHSILFVSKHTTPFYIRVFHILTM